MLLLAVLFATPVEILELIEQLLSFGSMVVSLCAARIMLHLLRMFREVELTEFVANST